MKKIIWICFFTSSLVSADSANNNWKLQGERSGLCSLEFYSHPIDGSRIPINILFLYAPDISKIVVKAEHRIKENTEYVFVTSSAKVNLLSKFNVTIEGPILGSIGLYKIESVIGPPSQVHVLNNSQINDFVEGLLNQQSFIVSFDIESELNASIVNPYGFSKSYEKYKRCKSNT